MIFEKCIGYQNLINTFKNIICSKQLAQSYIFIGEEGWGGLAFALNFGQWLVCFKNKSEDEPQWQQIKNSPSFHRATEFIHPDLHFLFPTVKKTDNKFLATHYLAEWRQFIKTNPYQTYNDWLQFIEAENKQGKITAEDCDEISRILMLNAYEGNNKVLIIWLPEHLGKEGNKLLKLIEEPPDNTYFILVSENSDTILETIKSRCQLVYFPKLTEIEVCSGLIQLFNSPESIAKRLANMVNGNFNLAIKLNTGQDLTYLDILKSWLNIIYSNKQVELQMTIEKLHKLGREKQKQFLKYFLWIIEQSIKILYRDKSELFFYQEELKLVSNINKIMDYEHKEEIVKLINKNIYFIERNVNSKLVFMAFSIQINSLLKTNEYVNLN